MSRSLSAVRRSARSLAVLLTAGSVLAATALAHADDGIDISHYQGSVNWSKVKADDITFAFMKATEGTSYADPTLATNWSGAEKVGIYRAAYHFARPSTASGSAAAQARFFVSKAGKFADPGDLPPVLDLEATGGLGPSALRSWVSTWLSTVEDLTGRVPILYFSPYFWIDHLGNSTAFSRYPLWIAHYTSGSPLVPGGWTRWTFWQRTSSGRVAGIAGNVDLNRFNGTSAQLAALAQTGGGSDGPVTPGPTLPTRAATSLSLTASTTQPAVGEQVTLSGTLARTPPATALARRPVRLWAREIGSTWAQVATATTDASGRWSVDVPVGATTWFQARFAQTPSYLAAAARRVRVLDPALPAVALDLQKDPPTPVAPGTPVLLFGHLTRSADGYADQEVRYYKRLPGTKAWTYVASTSSLAPTGWHSVTIHPQVTRVWKAVTEGSARSRPARSHYLTVWVRPGS